MKSNFNKVALAVSSAAVLAGASIPAHAIITGTPGEAQLVPFAAYSTAGFTGVPGSGTTTLDTIVKFTVPKSVGNGVIANCYTAPNSTPTNSTFGCNNTTPASEAPGAAGLATTVGGSSTSFIHWYYLDQNSNHKLNGKFPVSQDDTAVFSWSQADTQATYNNAVGYLVFVTENGNQQKAANFQFSADAYLVDTSAGGAFASASIPAIPMSDAADTGDAPTLNNNVLEYNSANQLVVSVSPLVTGQETIWSNGQPNNFVFDLSTGSTFNWTAGNCSTGAVAYPSTSTTVQCPGLGALGFVWNDRNARAWASVTAYRFNNNEQSCSGNISLPYQLNTFYIPPVITGSAGGAAVYQAGNPSPATSTIVNGPFALLATNTDPYGKQAAVNGVAGSAFPSTSICVPPTNVASGSQAGDYMGVSGGFLKLVLPEPATSTTNGPAGAAVTFSVPIDGNGYIYSTILGHSRGAFTTAPN